MHTAEQAATYSLMLGQVVPLFVAVNLGRKSPFWPGSPPSLCRWATVTQVEWPTCYLVITTLLPPFHQPYPSLSRMPDLAMLPGCQLRRNFCSGRPTPKTDVAFRYSRRGHY